MKRKDFIALYTVLNQLSNIKSTKFAYFVMKNLKILQPEIDIIRKLNELPEKYLEYESKRIDICKEFAEKDEEGNAIQKDGKYLIENREDFNKKIDELGVEYEEAIKEKGQKDIEITEFLMEDADLNFYKIKLDNLPELNAKHLVVLEELIMED